MRIPDDEKFEAYLKEFRPLAAEPLATSPPLRRARGTLALWMGAAAMVVILVAAAAVEIHQKRVRNAEGMSSGASNSPACAQPLTMRSANALMAKAPSFKAMVDDMAFRSQAVPLPKGKVSAVGVLAKEKVNL